MISPYSPRGLGRGPGGGWKDKHHWRQLLLHEQHAECGGWSGCRVRCLAEIHSLLDLQSAVKYLR